MGGVDQMKGDNRTSAHVAMQMFPDVSKDIWYITRVRYMTRDLQGWGGCT